MNVGAFSNVSLTHNLDIALAMLMNDDAVARYYIGPSCCASVIP